MVGVFQYLTYLHIPFFQQETFSLSLTRPYLYFTLRNKACHTTSSSKVQVWMKEVSSCHSDHRLIVYDNPAPWSPSISSRMDPSTKNTKATYLIPTNPVKSANIIPNKNSKQMHLLYNTNHVLISLPTSHYPPPPTPNRKMLQTPESNKRTFFHLKHHPITNPILGTTDGPIDSHAKPSSSEWPQTQVHSAKTHHLALLSASTKPLQTPLSPTLIIVSHVPPSPFSNA